MTDKMKSFVKGILLGLCHPLPQGEPTPPVEPDVPAEPDVPVEPVEYPVLAVKNTWYKGTTAKNTIAVINIVDSYKPTGYEAESWAADAGGTGSVMCYIDGEVLTIAGNGTGRISLSENARETFANFSAVIAIIGLNIIDTSNVTNMGHMFAYISITSLDLRSFDTSKATDMRSMFYFCEELSTIKVGDGWNIENANTTNMFIGCGTDSVTYVN